MSYFVYCNKCWTLPSRSVKYFLTQCGHIFCHNCVAQVKSAKKCVFCNKPTTVIQINKEADRNVTDFFMPIAALQKKIMEIDQFQMQRRTAFTEFLQKMIHEHRSQLRKEQDENKRLAAQIEVLTARLLQQHASSGGSSNSRDGTRSKRFQGSTPMPHVTSVTLSDNQKKKTKSVLQEVQLQHRTSHGGSSNSRDSRIIKRFQTSTPMSNVTNITSSQIDDSTLSVISGPNHRSPGCSKNSSFSSDSRQPGYARKAMMTERERKMYHGVPGSANSIIASSHQRIPTSGSMYQRRPLQPPTAVRHQQKQAGTTNTSLEYLRRMVNSRCSK